jgi:hypothetical protein
MFWEKSFGVNDKANSKAICKAMSCFFISLELVFNGIRLKASINVHIFVDFYQLIWKFFDIYCIYYRGFKKHWPAKS